MTTAKTPRSVTSVTTGSSQTTTHHPAAAAGNATTVTSINVVVDSAENENQSQRARNNEEGTPSTIVEVVEAEASSSIASRVSASSGSRVSTSSFKRPKRLTAAAAAVAAAAATAQVPQVEAVGISERKSIGKRRGRKPKLTLPSSGPKRVRKPRPQTLKIVVKSFLAEFSFMDTLEVNVNKNTDATWLEFLTENQVPVTSPGRYLIKTSKAADKITDKISHTLSRYARSCKLLNTVIVTQDSPFPFINVKQDDRDGESQEEIIVDVDEGSSDVVEFNYEAFVDANSREQAELQRNSKRRRDPESDDNENDNEESRQEEMEDDGADDSESDVSDGADDEGSNQARESEQNTREPQSAFATVAVTTTTSSSSSNNTHHQQQQPPPPPPPLIRMEEQAQTHEQIPVGPANVEQIANVVHSVPQQMYRNVSVVQGRQSGESYVPGMYAQHNPVPNNTGAGPWPIANAAARNVQPVVQQHLYPQMPHVSGNMQQPVQVQTNLIPPATSNDVRSVARGEFGDLLRDHVVRSFQSMPTEDILRVREELLTLRAENRIYAWSRHAPMTGFAVLNAFHI